VHTILIYALAYTKKYTLYKPEIAGWQKGVFGLKKSYQFEASQFCEIWGSHGVWEYLILEGSEGFIYNINYFQYELIYLFQSSEQATG